MVQFRQMLLVALLAVGASGQEFPFKDGPLDPSIHSNKIFFDTEGVEEIAGVWLVETLVMHEITLFPLFNGNITIDNLCEYANSNGIYFSHAQRVPMSNIILPSNAEGEIGTFVATRPDVITVSTVTEYKDGIMTLTGDDGCRTMRPYFDWELGKTMMVSTTRFYAWMEDGEMKTNYGEPFCVDGGVSHPYCSKSSFIIDGKEQDGVTLDIVSFSECVAGPCIELPWRKIPGYVRTEGWVPY